MLNRPLEDMDGNNLINELNALREKISNKLGKEAFRVDRFDEIIRELTIRELN